MHPPILARVPFGPVSGGLSSLRNAGCFTNASPASGGFRRWTYRAARARLPARGRVLVADVREMILRARAGVARAMDSGLATHYWHVGRRIRQRNCLLPRRIASHGTPHRKWPRRSIPDLVDLSSVFHTLALV
jgi:hypothetical protein